MGKRKRKPRIRDRHRLLVLDELEQLHAGPRIVDGAMRIPAWSGRAVGRLASILTRRHSDRWDGLELDRLAADHEGREEIVAWVLDWLRVVAAERQTTTWGGGFTAADQRPRVVEVRVAAGWVERATLEHVERLVDLALAWTERVREAKRGADRGRDRMASA
jgi:hypothetical protein